MAEILRRTELIVRGTIGSPEKAYLSKDQTDIACPGNYGHHPWRAPFKAAG